MKNSQVHVVILASGSGSTFRYLAENLPKDQFLVKGLVVSRRGVGAVERAKSLDIPVFFAGSDQELADQISVLQPNLIVLAGYLRKIPDAVLQRWPQKIINVHPSLLPKYGGKGMYGRRVHQAVFENNEKETGATVHWVTSDYDEGPVIMQKRIPVQAGDSVDKIESRVKDLEKRLLLESILSISAGQD